MDKPIVDYHLQSGSYAGFWYSVESTPARGVCGHTSRENFVNLLFWDYNKTYIDPYQTRWAARIWTIYQDMVFFMWELSQLWAVHWSHAHKGSMFSCLAKSAEALQINPHSSRTVSLHGTHYINCHPIWTNLYSLLKTLLQSYQNLVDYHLQWINNIVHDTLLVRMQSNLCPQWLHVLVARRNIQVFKTA